MDNAQIEWNEKIAARIIKNLQKRRMRGSYSATAEEAKNAVIELIPPKSSVYRCNSRSLEEIGLWEAVEKMPDIELIEYSKPDMPKEKKVINRRRGILADVMIASSNAITIDGKIVNLDGVGNRVASMIYGPKMVILVVGMNKVAPDLETAMNRVKHYAAPVDAIRLGVETPCSKNGICIDCRVPKRICNMWSIIEGQWEDGRLHVQLVGETLGY